MTTCTGVQRLFDAYWDDETTQAERELVEAHLAACAGCRGRYEQHAHTLEALAALPRIEAAPDLLERVTTASRRIARAPDVLPAAPAPVWAPAAAAAAVLVIGALVLVPMLQQRPDRLASVERRDLASVRQPELVRTVTATGGAAAGRTAAPDAAPRTAAPAPLAAMTDSLFDHGDDVEFILDPVALRRGSASARTVNSVQAERAVISF